MITEDAARDSSDEGSFISATVMLQKKFHELGFGVLADPTYSTQIL